MVTAFTNGVFFDSKKNCPATTTTSNGDVDDATSTGYSTTCFSTLMNNNVPLYNRPYVQINPTSDGEPKLAIAFNTNQVGRTFQDRSYLLQFKAAPSTASLGTIYNLNFRGRRGNIVQCYPAVENDFVPNKLSITTSDYVHIQFCGSDFNPQNNPNDGEGWQFSTRTNMVEMRDGDALAGPQNNFPKTSTAQTMFSSDNQKLLAFVGQDPTKCGPYDSQDNNNNANNAFDNCGKLNMMAQHFDAGLVQFNTAGVSYNYLSTRNNNFSNRSQKGVLTVNTAGAALTQAQSAAVGVGAAAAVALVGFVGMRAYSKKNPSSKTAAVYEKVTTGTAQTWSRIKGEENGTATGV